MFAIPAPQQGCRARCHELAARRIEVITKITVISRSCNSNTVQGNGFLMASSFT